MNKNNSEKDSLFPNPPENFKENYFHCLLEQYKVYVQTADNLIERRSQANKFFLSANSFLITALGILAKLGTSDNIGMWWLYVASIGGITFAITWMMLVRNYRQLSSSKYAVLNLIEQRLPTAPYSKEWEILDSGKNWKKYVKLTTLELIIPIVFIGLYVALSVGVYLLDNSLLTIT